MSHKQIFMITLHHENREFPGAMREKNIAVFEGLTVADLKRITNSQAVRLRDECLFKKGLLEFLESTEDNSPLLPGHGYELVSPNPKGKLGAFEKEVQEYERKNGYEHTLIPGTNYIMPPGGQKKYEEGLRMFIEYLHREE